MAAYVLAFVVYMVSRGKPLQRESSRVSLVHTSSNPNELLRVSSPLNYDRDPVVGRVIHRLLVIRGVVACHGLTRQRLRMLIHTETMSNRHLRLPGLEIVNEGIREVSSRKYAVAIAHAPQLRHPPGPILVICNGKQIVGEEVWKPRSNKGPPEDSNVIFLGRGLKLYRDGLKGSRGRPLKVFYRALRFPELETVRGVRDVVSVTVNTLTHMHLSRIIGWDANNPNLGTVLIGFNETVQ
jgi:hypothetical protein